MGSKKGGLLFGVIVGTLVGVLFAPRKGKDLRHQLKSEMEKGGMGGQTLKKNFAEMGKDIAHTAEIIYEQPEVQKQIKKGKKHVDAFLRNTLKQIDKTQDEMKKIAAKYYGIGQEKIEEAREHIEGGIKIVKKRIMNEEREPQKAAKKNGSNTSGVKRNTAKRSTSSKRRSAKKAPKKK